MSSHPDTFQVIDENVVLVGRDILQDVPYSERLHLPQPSIDTKATQEILDFFVQWIELKGPTLVDQLFHLVTTNFPQSHWFSMFKTSNDLSAFLKLFSDCFQIRSNLVTLLRVPKLSPEYIQQIQNSIHEQTNNNFGHSSNKTNSATARKTSNNGDLDFKLNGPVSNFAIMKPNQVKSEPNSGFDSFVPNFEITLQSLCENNCPKIGSSSNVSTASRSVNCTSTISKTNDVGSNNNNNNNININNRTFTQRINKLVVQNLLHNIGKEKQIVPSSKTSQNSAPPAPCSEFETCAVEKILPSSHNYFVGNAVKAKILQNTRVVSTVQQSLLVTNDIQNSKHNNEQIVISLDCKGMNLGINGVITMIEIGTTNGKAFIFDVLTCPNIMTDGGLKTLLENDRVIKIIHDCRNDSANLHTQFQTILTNVFDTQSAYAILQYQDSGRHVYKSKNLSLNKLAEYYYAPLNPMKDQLVNVYRKDQKYWERRPLTREMTYYAARDVLVLIDEQLYGSMARYIDLQFLSDIRYSF